MRKLFSSIMVWDGKALLRNQGKISFGPVTIRVQKAAINRLEYEFPGVDVSKLDDLVHWKLQEEFSSEIDFFFKIVSKKKVGKNWKVDLHFFRDDALYQEIDRIQKEGNPVNSVLPSEDQWAVPGFLPIKYRKKAFRWNLLTTFSQGLAFLSIGLLFAHLFFLGSSLSVGLKTSSLNNQILSLTQDKLEAINLNENIETMRSLFVQSAKVEKENYKIVPLVAALGQMRSRTLKFTEIAFDSSQLILEIRGNAGPSENVLSFLELAKKTPFLRNPELKKLTGMEDGTVTFHIISGVYR